MNLENVFQAEKIIKKRLKKGEIEYYVKWKDWSIRHCTWEPRENILDRSLLQMFELTEQANSIPKKRGRKRKHRPVETPSADSSMLTDTEIEEKTRDPDEVHSPQSSNGETSAVIPSTEENVNVEETLNNNVISADPPASDENTLISNVSTSTPKSSPWDKIKIPKKVKPVVARKPSITTTPPIRRPVGRPRKISNNPSPTVVARRKSEDTGEPAEKSSESGTSTWNETEVVVTDIKVNSSVVTFLECATRNGLLS